jgi:hypothetical protein
MAPGMRAWADRLMRWRGGVLMLALCGLITGCGGVVNPPPTTEPLISQVCGQEVLLLPRYQGYQPAARQCLWQAYIAHRNAVLRLEMRMQGRAVYQTAALGVGWTSSSAPRVGLRLWTWRQQPRGAALVGYQYYTCARLARQPRKLPHARTLVLDWHLSGCSGSGPAVTVP